MGNGVQRIQISSFKMNMFCNLIYRIGIILMNIVLYTQKLLKEQTVNAFITKMCGEACTKTIVEKHEQGCLVATQFHILETLLLDFACLGKCLLQVAKVFCIEKSFHMISV